MERVLSDWVLPCGSRAGTVLPHLKTGEGFKESTWLEDTVGWASLKKDGDCRAGGFKPLVSESWIHQDLGLCGGGGVVEGGGYYTVSLFQGGLPWGR